MVGFAVWVIAGVLATLIERRRAPRKPVRGIQWLRPPSRRNVVLGGAIGAAAWLGLPPELFFQPPRIRTENTPEIIAHHLCRDPNLTDQAARHIAGLVRELYTSLARPPREVRIRLRAAPTFKPKASRLLGELLEDMQHKLTTDGGPQSAAK